jgi:hypothetical protein
MADFFARPGGTATLGDVAHVVQLGAKLVGVALDHGARAVRAKYELVDAAGHDFGCGGEIAISFEALDAVDATLGGREPLTAQEQIDLVGKIIRPLFVATFTGAAAGPEVEQPPERPPEPRPAAADRQDAFVECHGEIVDMRNRAPGLPDTAKGP